MMLPEHVTAAWLKLKLPEWVTTAGELPMVPETVLPLLLFDEGDDETRQYGFVVMSALELKSVR